MMRGSNLVDLSTISRFAIAICMTLAAIPAASAAGEEPSADGPEPQADVEDIIVTAQKREEKALDVPASLTIVAGEDLVRGGNVSTLNLTFFTPGLKMDRSGASTAPSLRGVTSLLVGPGFEPNIATYVDGVYVSDPSGVIDLPDTAGITILKGPQGTLFGRNATGGAIQITTFKPSFDFKGTASASYGRFNDISGKAFITGPLIADKLAASISLYRQTNDGFLHDIIADRRYGSFSAYVVRAKLLFTPTENSEFVLAATKSRRSDKSLQSALPIDGVTAANLQIGAIVPTRPYDRAFNRPSMYVTNAKDLSLQGKVEFDPGTLNLVASYSDHVSKSDQPGYQAFAPAGGLYYTATQPDKSYTAELNFVSKDYGSFNYIIGAYGYRNAGSYSPLLITGDFPTASSTLIYSRQTSRAYAGFGEVNVRPFDKLTATFGIRYSTEKRAIRGGGIRAAVLPAPPPIVPRGEVRFSAWTPRFSLRYEIAPSTNVYFTYSKGFKSGGYNASEVFGSTGPLTALKPEKLDAYEIGFKTSPSHRLTLSASAFYYKYKDQQVSALVNRNGVDLRSSTNAAASTIKGGELEARWQATDELSFRTGISLLNARFDSFPTATQLVPTFAVVGGVLKPVGNRDVPADASGNALPRSPDATASFGATYEKEFAAGTLRLKADFFRSDNFYFDPANRFEQRAYSNLDASASWALPDDAWTFTLWGRNLTNATVAAGSFVGSLASSYYYAAPRTYGVTIGAQF